ncbi:MAG: ABC transporter ATP-binding protein [Sphaerobacteraceae bacterium]|nr:MAG: ABC transporter ATP-binding protein [Sphaerobacteraceae bacterium]
MPALIEAKNVTKIFGGGLLDKSRTVALKDFSFQIDSENPSVTSIVGESGSGKTTLARMLLGLAAPTEGEVLYNGKNLEKLSGSDRRQFLRDVQVIFQDPFEVYNPFYRIDHVLETPIKNFRLADTEKGRRDLMIESLEAVGIRPEEILGRFPHELSGGQRQRIMVARALLLRPKLIIADEPVSMVDASLRATILGSLLRLNREFGISLIYITHDLTTAFQVSEDIMVLYRGSLAEAGDVDQVVRHPEHPYTRLLVGSIPLPDPDLPWEGERAIGRPAGELGVQGDEYCQFHDRCPYAMPMCVQTHPPLFHTHPNRVTSCYLYRESPELPMPQMTSIFKSSNREGPPEETEQLDALDAELEVSQENSSTPTSADD